MIAAYMKKKSDQVALQTTFNALKVFGLTTWTEVFKILKYILYTQNLGMLLGVFIIGFHLYWKVIKILCFEILFQLIFHSII